MKMNTDNIFTKKENKGAVSHDDHQVYRKKMPLKGSNIYTNSVEGNNIYIKEYIHWKRNVLQKWKSHD